jgi:methylated-DNA-[protein]-cysteine S-methyltransferase
MDTPIGPLTFLVGPDGVVAGGFTTDPTSLQVRLPMPSRVAELVERNSLGEISTATNAYFGGDVTAWDRLPVVQHGGPFIQQVWHTLRTIPAGNVVTYTELAALAGRPDAVRAAAAGCATNLVAPIVPCHRVVGRDGTLRGYYYGLSVKRWLIDHEAKAVRG